jgi:hypothetical protein
MTIPPTRRGAQSPKERGSTADRGREGGVAAIAKTLLWDKCARFLDGHPRIDCGLEQGDPT